MQVTGMPMQAGYPAMPGYPQVGAHHMAFAGMMPSFPGQMMPQQMQQLQAMPGTYQPVSTIAPAMMSKRTSNMFFCVFK
jgi:hypothetical protein